MRRALSDWAAAVAAADTRRLRAVAGAYQRVRGTAISAMVRVRDEEEFLRAAVDSILPLVDEVVLIDNLSRDATPEIIADLARRHPDRITTHRYPYEILRVGHETAEFAARPESHASPHLSANYYNWCLRRCRRPFVLKWDGDMIALPALAGALAAWRASRRPVLMIRGANVHPGRRHLLAARTADRARLEAGLRFPRVPSWTTSLTYDALEPRLFPRLFGRYDSSPRFTQGLASPFAASAHKAALRHEAPAPSFLHMKFCKRDPFTNYSDDLAAVLRGNCLPGPPIDSETLAVLHRHGVAHPHDGRAYALHQ